MMVGLSTSPTHGLNQVDLNTLAPPSPIQSTIISTFGFLSHQLQCAALETPLSLTQYILFHKVHAWCLIFQCLCNKVEASNLGTLD